jgi:polyphosphate kinase 2 (PPK2 family)
MSNKHPKKALSHLLSEGKFPTEDAVKSNRAIKELQLKMLRIQQGIWHSKRRAIVVLEGFDAAGKGGSIRRLTASLDPRSISVHSVGPPTPREQGRHYLYRFWRDLPDPGTMAIFDRSWYGRVLVERVENLTPKGRWKDAYNEIVQFEEMLINDGVDLVKIFLAIHPGEQLKRFEARLRDPYRQWKLTDDDVEGHRKWKEYVRAGDDLLHRTSTKSAPWNLIAADSKEYARNQVLRIVTHALSHHGDWMESVAQKKKHRELHKALKELEKEQR